MKLAALISAGLIAATAIVPAAATAQDRHDRVVTRTVHTVSRPRTRQVCNTVYRHHQRTRVCRTVRY